MFSKSPLALVIGAVLASPAVLAETAKTDEHMVVEGRDYGYKADTNTTAMRMEATQLETPGQISIIDEQLIDEQRASTLGEVLQNDASVSAGGTSRNRERFSLRGFDLESSSGFLRDGKQHWSHYRQPIELLERVEVVKGPSGLLYGQSAPGGLINMVAKKPTYETQVSVSQDIGSNDHSRTVVDVSGSLNEAQTLRARTVIAKESYSSWREYGDGSKPQTERLVGGLFVDYDVTEDVLVSLHYDRTNDDGSVDSGALFVDGKQVGSDKHIWDAQWSEIENDVENVGIDVNANLTDSIRLSTGFNYQDFERTDVESFPGFDNLNPDGTGTVSHGGSHRQDNWRFRTAYLDVVSDFELVGMEHQFLVGSNWLGYSYKRDQLGYNSVDVAPGESVGTPTLSGNDRHTFSSYDSWGFYAQDLISINEQWQVLAGVRFDRKVANGVAEEHVSPKLGAIYHPAENGSVYLTYSESFEPQGMVSSGRRTYTNDGELLDAKVGKSYEAGTKWELMDNSLFVSGAIFDITQDSIALDVKESNGDYTKTQSGEQHHRGAEISAQGFITEQLSLSGSTMYLDAEIVNHETYAGNRPADVPEFSASLWSKYSVTNATDVNVGVIYEGSRYGDDANTFKKDGYTRVDMGVAYTLKYDADLDMIVRFNVENLFDTDYLAGGGSTDVINGQVYADGVVIGEGRNYMATLQVKY
ncbi:TonB-dependent siderophore receptor [Vibrio splendidus]|uniref:TonB-dependent siderophore receptor n=1 Tax=Vibrio splendidus TaxID=29497 RepID=UPI0003630905|nr:TonB-dependent siderophore receptor [Vibrio splendidus]MDH5895839.1 TonB-dependent siderophore receptor [Vibrio splendidus]